MKYSHLLLAGFLATPLLAQTNVQVHRSQGMFTGFPVGIQHVDDEVAASHDPTLVIRSGSVSNGSLQDPASPGFAAHGEWNPDFSPEALYAHWVPAEMGISFWHEQYPGCVVELGGMSTGGDVCPPVQTNGRLDMSNANTTWYVLTMGVGPNALGRDGSLVQSAGAEAPGYLFSYGAEGSQGIEEEFVDAVRVDYTRDQMGLPSPSRGISAVDWGMGIIARTPNGQGSVLQPERKLFYFSVTQDWIDNHASSGGMDARLVYYMEWIPNPQFGSGNPGEPAFVWSDPGVAFDLQDLYGTQNVAGELDAISVYVGDGSPGAPDRTVFSMTPVSLLDGGFVNNQILVTQRDSTLGSQQFSATYAQALKTENGTRFTTKLGLKDGPNDPDNVRNLCGRDPFEINSADLYAGRPTCTKDGGSGDQGHGIGLSMLRHGDVPGDGIDHGTLLLQVSGIDLEPTELGGLYFDFEVVDVSAYPNQLLWSYSSPTPVLVLFGELTRHVEGPFTLDLTQYAGTSIELRTRARLSSYDLVTGQYTYNSDMSWSSVLKLQ